MQIIYLILLICSTLVTFFKKYGWPKFLAYDQNVWLGNAHDFFLICNTAYHYATLLLIIKLIPNVKRNVKSEMDSKLLFL